jgi:hypothetical protein
VTWWVLSSERCNGTTGGGEPSGSGRGAAAVAVSGGTA